MIKVLQINVEVNRNSTGRITEQIGNMIIEEGMQSYIAYSRGSANSTSKTIRIGNKFTILTHVVKTRLLGDHVNGSTYQTKSLIKKIQKANPDIIHLHQIHGYYLNIEVLFDFLASYKKPVVWTLHDCWAFTGHCSYFTRVGCYKWKSECNDCPQYNKYPASWFFDHSKEQFYAKKRLFNQIPDITFVTVSDWVRNLAKQSFIAHQNIVTINNGVDISTFKYREEFQIIKKELGIENKFILLGVGTTWNESKGIYDFFRLSELLPDDMVIVLVGLSSSQLPKKFNNIFAIERTHDIEELVKLYSMADVLLSLSYQESFGLTPIEAMACGTPSIVYNATALPELISEGVGYVVEPGDFIDVLSKINKIKTNGKRYYIEACRDRAEKNYDKHLNYKKYINIYKSLVNNNK